MAVTADSSKLCPNCGERVGLEAPLGLCARCLMAQYLTPTEGLAPDPHDTTSASAVPGSSGEICSSFGDYDLLGEIGRGGMGVVHRARQRGLDRIIALKMIIPSRLTSGTDLQRFRLEAETAARLDHPSILPIYEIGEISGQPYFTTKYLEGGSLAQQISERRHRIDEKTIHDQVRLFLKVCQAVAYAHARGVLHRDLKPANIVLDREGEPYVADFGLARLLEQESDLTLSQAMVGTPAYAAPEQLRGGVRHLTTAADVYSLGAVLYEMLSGRPPLRGPTTAETVRQVLDEDPKPLRALNPAVDRDLEAICRKCLEKDPRQRYANAGELTRELEHYLAGEPIQARPLDTVTLAWRWCRRRPAIAGLIGAIAIAVLAVALVASVAGFRIATARKAEQRESYYASIALADHYIQRGDISRAKELLFSCPPEFRNWEWGHLLFRCHQEILSIPAHTEIELTLNETALISVDLMQDLRWDAGGMRLATLGRDGSVRVWDSTDGRRLFRVADTNHPATAVVFHPTKEQLAVAFRDGMLEVWNTTTGRQHTVMRSDAGPLLQLAWHSEGRWLAGASQRVLRVWDTSSWEVVGSAQLSADIRSVAFTPDGGQVMVQTRSEARLYDPAGRQELRVIRAPPEPGISLFVDPVGKRWVTVSTLGEVWLWQDAERGIRLGSIQRSHPDRGGRVFFSPDGTRFCTGGSAATARVWDATTGREILAIPSGVNDAVFSPDGRVLAVSGSGTTAQLWDLERKGELLTLRGHSDLVARIAFSPDGRRVATAGREGIVKLWSASPGREILPERGWIWGRAVSPDGKRIATSSSGSREFTIWNATSGRRLLTVDTVVQDIFGATFSPNGGRYVTTGRDNVGRVWDVRTGQLLLNLKGHTGFFLGVDYSPGGEWIATGSWDQTTRIWDASTGRELQCLSYGTQGVYAVKFSPEGRRLAAVGDDGLALWDLSSGRLLLRVPGTDRMLGNVVFGPGKDRLTLAYNGDPELRICDARTGRMLGTWKLRGMAGGYSFSADARRLVVAVSKDFSPGNDFQAPSAELWDVELGRRILTLEGHTEAVSQAWFTGDGQRIVTSSGDFTVRQWESFPWQSTAYPGSPKEPLPDRVQQYARTYWQARLAAEEAPSTLVRARPPRESLWPPRDPAATPDQIDLTTHYTALLNSHFTPYDDWGSCNDLSELPCGLVEFGGVRFDVRGLIFLRKGGVERMLAPWQVLWERCPAQTGDIAVGRPVRQLHVLHGVASPGSLRQLPIGWQSWQYRNLHGVTSPEAVGQCVGRWIWRYEDGTEKVTQVLYGNDVQDWWFKPGQRAKDEPGPSRVVWTGSNAFVQYAGGYALRLSLRTWDNPRPDAVVRSLRYVSSLTESAPFVIAISVE